MAYKKVPSSGSFNQVQSKAVLRAFQHVESLAVAQIAKDVHSKVVAPVGHVSRLSPALGVGISVLEANLLAESTDVVEDVSLHLLHGTLGKGVREHASLAGVNLLVASVVGVGDGVSKRVVEFSLANIGLEAVDVLEGLLGAK